MNGPFVAGTFSSSVAPSEWDWEYNRMIRGRTYCVAEEFVDADGDAHCVGEKWVFITSMFSKFDDELTLCVELASDGEWKIPLLWKPGAHEAIIENFSRYVTPC